MLLNAVPDPVNEPSQIPDPNLFPCFVYLRGGQTLQLWFYQRQYDELSGLLENRKHFRGPQEEAVIFAARHQATAPVSELVLRIDDISGLSRLQQH